MQKIKNKIGAEDTSVSFLLARLSSLPFGLQKEVKKMFFLSLLLFTSVMGFSTGEIGKKILSAKADGSQFVSINNLLLKNTNYHSQSIQQQVINPKYFDFDKNVALDLIHNKEQYITMLLPSATNTNQNITVELMAVSEVDYDFTITTGSGLQYSGRDIQQVHYRGVVRNMEATSLVFLSVSEDNISMDISYDNNEQYEIYLDEAENIHVLYEYIDIAHLDEPFICGDAVQNLATSQGGTKRSRAKETDKCLYLFMEAEYEIFLQAGTLDKLEKRILETFNKTAGLFEDIGVTLRLSELKLWDIPDPYTYNTATGTSLSGYQTDFANKKADYISNATIPTDVHLAHFLTTYYSGGIQGTAGLFKCIDGVSSPPPSLQRFDGACNSKNCRKSYVKTMTHEIGHSLSCGHTKDCHWNGNCTPLDNAGLFPANTVCNGTSVGPCGAAPDPEEGFWTVMSAQGEFSYWKGFGDQPGDLIEDFVNSQNCLSSCIVSCDDLKDVIVVSNSDNVYDGEEDYRHSEIATFADNEIYAGGRAQYYSSTRVYLNPGFKARLGSDFHGAIKPCINYGNVTVGSSRKKSSSEIKNTLNYQTKGAFAIRAYPNPTKGQLVIELDGNMTYNISLFTVLGKVVYEDLNMNSSRIELDISQEKQGVYILQVMNQEGQIETMKLILE